MRKIYFLIIILLSISCKKTNEKSNNEQPIIKKSSNQKDLNKKNKTPLFLSLSPNMTDKEFDYEIENLNISGELDKGRFIIKSGDDQFSFNVERAEDYIYLHTHKPSNFNYINYKEYRNGTDQNYNRFIKFVDKIKNNFYERKNEVLTNQYVKAWNKQDLNIEIYADSSETILIHYNINYDEYDSEQDIKEKYKTFHTNENGNIVRSNMFIFTMLIQYHYTKSFNKMLEDKIRKNIKDAENVSNDFKIKKEKEKFLEDNIKKI